MMESINNRGHANKPHFVEGWQKICEKIPGSFRYTHFLKRILEEQRAGLLLVSTVDQYGGTAELGSLEVAAGDASRTSQVSACFKFIGIGRSGGDIYALSNVTFVDKNGKSHSLSLEEAQDSKRVESSLLIYDMRLGNSADSIVQ